MTVMNGLDPQPTLPSPAGPSQPRRAHLVGAAGSGMRALAEVLLGRGWKLSGSDLATDSTERLADAGVCICEGHAAENLPPDADLLVHSDAVPADNPELRRAAELGIPVLSYFQVAGQLMSAGRGLAVAGTHGKSTVTAMAAHVFASAGCDPTVLCGAAPLGKLSGGRAGQGEIVLVEACEYRANFLHLRPQQAVILGVEPDHFDYYSSPDDLESAFARFAQSVPPEGLILARHDCPVTRRLTAALPCRLKTFGIGGRADWSAWNLTGHLGRYGFEICRHGEHLCNVSLEVPGKHNVLNALAAAAMTFENGVRPVEIAHALRRFRGLHRRLELLGTYGGVLLVDDYAHHPTAVSATLATVRRMVPNGRLWCVFQPHQVSRTEHLLDELAASLQNADRVLVADVFRAREAPPRDGEVTAADLARRIRHGGVEVSQVHALEEIARMLPTRLAPGDVLITMGAGDVGKICHGLMRQSDAERVAAA